MILRFLLAAELIIFKRIAILPINVAENAVARIFDNMEVFPARLLMLHVENFWYRPNIAESNQGKEIGESLHVLIHSEDRDKNNRPSVLRKMLKNIRWLAKKIDCNNVTLHSFAHLSDSKSDPDFADSLIMDVASNLRERNYKVNIVPFGAFYEFKMHVKGPSLAKVFKSF